MLEWRRELFRGRTVDRFSPSSSALCQGLLALDNSATIELEEGGAPVGPDLRYTIAPSSKTLLLTVWYPGTPCAILWRSSDTCTEEAAALPSSVVQPDSSLLARSNDHTFVSTSCPTTQLLDLVAQCQDSTRRGCNRQSRFWIFSAQHLQALLALHLPFPFTCSTLFQCPNFMSLHLPLLRKTILIWV